MTATAVDVLDRLRRRADHPSAFLAFNDDVEHFAPPDSDGVVAYRMRGRTALLFAGPFGPPDERAALLTRFTDLMDTNTHGRVTMAAAQVRHEDVDLFRAAGWTVNPFGSTYAVDLSRFTLRGKPLAKIRQNMSRARREGVAVREVGRGEDLTGLDEIDRRWLRDKGWHVKRLTFLVGERGGRGDAERRLFVAERDGVPIGYISYSPAFGRRSGWLYDLTRRSPDASVGTIELINQHAIERFTAEGAGWLHLGFTPFTRLDDGSSVAASRLLSSMLRLLASHGSAVYPARTQEAFKLKWAPHEVEPEYVAFRGGPRPSSLWQLLRITNSI